MSISSRTRSKRGLYRYRFLINDCIDIEVYSDSDPYDDERVKGYDRKLQRILTEIFHERCPTKTSGQMKEFFRASEDGDPNSAIMKLILERESTLSEIFPKGTTTLSLLWIAVICCYQNSAELLVRSGADVNEHLDKCIEFAESHDHEADANEVVNHKMSMLQLLLKMYPSSWNERFIALILEHGANIQIQDSLGKTALHYAVSEDRVQAVKLLLEKGANVNVAAFDGRTPLLEAVACSVEAEVTSLLIEHGADVTVRDKRGMNALHYLAEPPDGIEDVNLARVLIEKGTSLEDVEHCGQWQTSCQPLHFAVMYGNNELVKLFLDHGANANSKLPGGVLPLNLVRNPAVLKTLLKGGANVDLTVKNGYSALHSACSNDNNRLENIRILLSIGADNMLLVDDYEGKTPFALIQPRRIGNSRIKLMLRMLALKKSFLEPSIEVKDEMIIANDWKLWNYYQNCVEKIYKGKSTRFIDSWTFFDFLTKCQCQIAELMRNREFESKFKLCNLSGFPYAEEMRRAFKLAQAFHQSRMKQEEVINEAVYCMLPHLIVRKVAHYALACEICEIRKIVHASRTAAQQ